jgi:hypothetical protein
MYKGVTKVWEDCVYPKGDFEEWHKVNCLMGESVECGVGKLSICPNECFANGSWVVAWKYFKQDIGVVDERRSKNRIKEAFKGIATSMFLYILPMA